MHQALRAGRSHEVHRLTQLLGGKGIGVRRRIFFHLLGSRPEQEELKAHVTMLGARGRMDAQVVDKRETGREFQADVPRAAGHGHGDKSGNNAFQHSKRAGERKQAPRWSAPAELFLMCASPPFLSVRPRRREGVGVEEITTSAKKYGFCSGTRAESDLRTMRCALLKGNLD